MKIVKTASETPAEIMKREKANEGCSICPCCGEDMDSLEAIKGGHGLKRVITPRIVEVSKKEGWFSQEYKLEYKLVKKYHCSKCGTEWESDPY